MPVEAQLFDGTILEFPDGTDEGVISSKAKELTLQRQTPLSQPAEGPIKKGGRMLADLLPSTAKVIEAVKEPVSRIMQGPAAKMEQIAPGIPQTPEIQSVTPIDQKPAVGLNRPIADLLPSTAQVAENIRPVAAGIKEFGRGVQEGANLGLTAMSRLLPFPGIMDAAAGKTGDLGQLLNPLPRVATDALEAIRGKVGHDTFKLVEDILMSGAAHGVAPAIRSARTAINMRRAGPIPEFGEVMDGGLAPGAEAQALRPGAAARGVQAAQRDALAQRQLPAPEMQASAPKAVEVQAVPQRAVQTAEPAQLPPPAVRPPPRTLRQVNEAEAAAKAIPMEPPAAEAPTVKGGNKAGDAPEPLSTEFTKEGDKYGRGMIVHPSTKTPGNWQASAFDKRGFAYDEQFKTRAEAVQFAQTGGMQPTAKDASKVDQLAKTEEFQKGNEQTRITGMHNELSFKSDNNGAQKVQGIYDAEGFDAAQAFTRERLARIEAAKAAGKKKPYLVDEDAAAAEAPKSLAESTIPDDTRRPALNPVQEGMEKARGKQSVQDRIAKLEAENAALREKQPTVETDAAKRQEIRNSILEGEMILKGGKEISGRKIPEGRLAGIRRAIDKNYAQLGETPRETITPANDTKIGKNAAGEQLYKRANGDVYRMRGDRKDKPDGYPDFGGDLAPVKKPLQVRKGQILEDSAQAVKRAARRSAKGDIDPVVNKLALDSARADAENVSDVIKGETVPSKSNRGVDVPSDPVVVESVVNALHDPKIREAVVKAVPVDVVNDLIRKKGATKVPLHDKAVLQDQASSVVGQDPISLSGEATSSLSDAVTGLATKQPLRSTKGTGSAVKDIPASGASDVSHADDIAKKPTRGKKKSRTIKEILESEEGSIKMGPIRVKNGRTVEAPSKDEVTKAVSTLRLIGGNTVEESSKTIRKTMGPAGNELVDKVQKFIRDDAKYEAGRVNVPLQDMIKKFDEADHRSGFDFLEGKTGKTPRPEVMKAALYIRDALKDVATEAEAVKLKIKNPLTGQTHPWQPRKDFMPHFFKESFEAFSNTKDGRAKIKASIERHIPDANEAEVQKRFEEIMAAARLRYGHLEMARVFNRPDYIKDLGVVEKYITDSKRRIAIAREFGPEMEKGEKLLRKIGEEHGHKAENFAREYMQRATDTEPEGNLAFKEFSRTMRNFNAGSLLGQAVISNSSQSVFTAVYGGPWKTVKGTASSMTSEGHAFGRKILNDSVADFLKEGDAHYGRSGHLGGFADTVMKYTGFSWVEKMNRIVAANTGRHMALDMFDKLQKNPTSKKLRAGLEKLRVNVDDALERGELSEMDQLRAGGTVVNKTQFQVDVSELPLSWSTDAGRLLTQFKSFQFKAGQFVKDEIVLEAAKRGNLKPLLIAALLFPAAGFAVMKGKDAVRWGEQREKETDVMDWLGVLGTYGAFTDAFAPTGRQPVKGLEQLAGPTLGLAGRLLEGTAGIAGYAPWRDEDEGKWRPLAKTLASRIPTVGPSIRQQFNEPKSELAQKKADTDKKLKELGIIKPKKMSREKKLRELGLR
jgi:hypothetical protein